MELGLAAVRAGGELDDVPFLEAVWTPGFHDEGHVRFEVVLRFLLGLVAGETWVREGGVRLG